MLDLERGTEETPKIEGMNWNPVWLPDGRLSFTSMRKGDFDVYVKDVAGAGGDSAVLAGPDDTDPIAWTRDGRLVFQGSEPDGAYPLKLFDPREPTRITRLTEQHVDNGGSLSPDEHWLAYQSAVNRAIGRVRALADPPRACGRAVAGSRGVSGLSPRWKDAGPRARPAARLRSWRDNNGRSRSGPERVVAQLGVRVGMDLRRTVRVPPMAAGSWRSSAPRRCLRHAFVSCSAGITRSRDSGHEI